MPIAVAMSEYYDDNEDLLAQVTYHYPPVGIGRDENYTNGYGFGEEFGMIKQTSAALDRLAVPDKWHHQYEPDSPEAIDHDYIPEIIDWEMESWPQPLFINIDHTYNESTRQVDIDVTGTFRESVSADLRFYVVLVQGHVASNSSGYEQAGWKESEPYDFRNVAKYMPGGFFGVPGTIPSSVSIGDEYTENFTFELPEFASDDPRDVVPIDPEDTYIIASVVKNGDPGDRPVLATNKIDLVSSKKRGIPVPPDVRVHTTQEDSMLSVDVETKHATTFDITLFDYRGVAVSSTPSAHHTAGIHRTQFATQGLKPGAYFIKVKTPEKDYTKRALVAGK